eukprot:gene14491-17100_t
MNTSLRKMMTVICLEGCHGSGKTELCKYLSSQGHHVLDEAFLDMPSFNIHPQSLMMESVWVTNWFQRLLKVDLVPGQHKLFFADRSPYSAVLYARNGGKLLDPIIRAQIAELRELANIDIKTVYLQLDEQVLWQRIQDRLAREPERRKYDEHNPQWLKDALSFYDHPQRWDLTIDNSQSSSPSTRLSHILSSILETELRAQQHSFIQKIQNNNTHTSFSKLE